MVLFWDASGLAKRYIAEQGSDVADAIFDAVALRDMVSTPWSYAETYAILLRRRNGRVISEAAFVDALTSLQKEVVNPDFVFLSITDEGAFCLGRSCFPRCSKKYGLKYDWEHDCPLCCERRQ